MITNLTPNIISRFQQWCLDSCLVAYRCSHCVFLAQYPVSPICWLHFGFMWLYGGLMLCRCAHCVFFSRAAESSSTISNMLAGVPPGAANTTSAQSYTALADTKLKNFKSKSVRCDGKLNEFPLCQLHSYTGLTTEHTGWIEKLITANLVFWLLSIVECRIDS